MRNTKMAKAMIPAILATLIALTAVAGVGARDAQAATTMSDVRQRDATVNHAYKMLKAKVPYKAPGSATCSMSGASPECLNRLSYAKANIKLPYYLGGQIDAGRVTNAPKRGDLIFFDPNGDGDYRDARDRTGVYVGNGWFIHQSPYQKKTVRTSLHQVAYMGPSKFVSVVPFH